MAFMNYNSADNYVVSRLYKIKKPKEKQETELRNEHEYFKVGYFQHPKEWL